MKRRVAAGGICFLASLAVLSVAPGAFATGIFEATADIGGTQEGGTTFVGYAEVNGRLVGQYLMTCFGGDLPDDRDRFHFAYRKMTGSVRVSAAFQRVDGKYGGAPDTTGKYGAMIRAAAEDSAAHCAVLSGPDGSLVQLQVRAATNAGSASENYEGRSAAGAPAQPCRVGIQRIMLGGTIPVIEGLVDWGKGAGWERVGTLKVMPDLPEEVLIGLAVASDSTSGVAQALASDVLYETNMDCVGPATAPAMIPPGPALATAPTGVAGLKVRTIKALYTEGWNRTEMGKLLDFGCAGPVCQAPGMPVGGIEAGERIVPFVNLHDTGDRGAFRADNGFPDESFPGIDCPESPTADPAAGDDDNHFATEVTGLVELTAGYHIFAVNDADGTIVEVGGIEIGRSGQWKDTSNTDFAFRIERAGRYTVRARHLAGSGGAALELHEVIRIEDGTFRRILLGDVAGGGSATFCAQ